MNPLEYEKANCIKCGSKAIIHRGERWSVRCTRKSCGEIGPQVHDVPEAVDGWNAINGKRLTARSR